MNFNRNLKYIFCCLIFALAFAFTGSAYAQHEGGLGIKKIHINIAEGTAHEDRRYDRRSREGYYRIP